MCSSFAPRLLCAIPTAAPTLKLSTANPADTSGSARCTRQADTCNVSECYAQLARHGHKLLYR